MPRDIINTDGGSLRPGPWAGAGLCRQADPALFYPEAWSKEASKAAKRVCRACPVAIKCLAFALAVDEQHGVWGGLSEHERRRPGAPSLADVTARLHTRAGL